MQHHQPDPELITAAVRLTEDIGRIRLSESFFFRDFLYSEVATVTGLPNIPSDVDAAVWAGRRLCQEVLEPLQQLLGPIRIRSGYRSETVNQYGNRNRLGCASNESNFGRHIWDRQDERGARGAMACIVIPALTDHYQRTGDWQSFAWFIHDHLPYSEMTFFSRLAAFNIGWSSAPRCTIDSFISPNKGYLHRPDLFDRPSHRAGAYEDKLPDRLRFEIAYEKSLRRIERGLSLRGHADFFDLEPLTREVADLAADRANRFLQAIFEVEQAATPRGFSTATSFLVAVSQAFSDSSIQRMVWNHLLHTGSVPRDLFRYGAGVGVLDLVRRGYLLPSQPGRARMNTTYRPSPEYAGVISALRDAYRPTLRAQEDGDH